jgi:2-polyprenyl-6-methoxyphenol hydroxylase-like FAD-dependent oxidoreductase
VIGDAVSSFNPVYGQGMSSAAQQAAALDRSLAGGSHDLARRYFAAAAKVVDTPWLLAVGTDLRFPESDRPRSRAEAGLDRYLDRLQRIARHDPVVALAFFEVLNLFKQPPSLLRPAIAVRVLAGGFGTRRPARQRPPVAAVDEALPSDVSRQPG